MTTALTASYAIPPLPPSCANFETPELTRLLVLAHRHLAELKGSAKSIPNQSILINTLALQEAKASSEVESFVTTQDELFQANLHIPEWVSPAAKEVSRYREALMLGYRLMLKQKGLLTNSLLIEMFQLLKDRNDGFRTSGGTVLKNEMTGETVFVPPQNGADIQKILGELEQFINDPELSELDLLVKMALIHHQFESIHPFPDGNGRIGRIICVLYLVQNQLLDSPVLYLSRYINKHKSEYYRLLQKVRDENESSQDQAWHDWVLFMLKGVADTAEHTVRLVEEMRGLMSHTKNLMREKLPRIYSQDLLNNLFRHPYTRIEFVQEDLDVARQTAARYLRQLVKIGILQEHSRGKNVYFINLALLNLLSEGEKG